MKRIIVYTAILFLSSVSFAFCQVQRAHGFVIKGTISGAADGSLVRLVALDEQQVLDSARTAGGKFTLQGKVNNATACWLQCSGEYAILMVENVPMTFTSLLKDMVLNNHAAGGKEQALQTKLQQLQRRYDVTYMHAYDSLQHKLYTSDADKKRLITVFNSAQDSSMLVYVAFGKHHPDSYLGQDILYRNRKTIPHDTLEQLYRRMPPALKANQKGQGIKLFLYSALAEKGKPMIDFEVTDINGKVFKLSALKGKYIYLTFGSIGCGPCRMENRALASNYNKLSPQVAVVTFSLDRHKKDWLQMTKEDGIVWYNVSDLKGDGNIKTLYNVQAIPTAFLIDPQGVIIERYEGYSEDLINDIEKKSKGA